MKISISCIWDLKHYIDIRCVLNSFLRRQYLRCYNGKESEVIAFLIYLKKYRLNSYCEYSCLIHFLWLLNHYYVNRKSLWVIWLLWKKEKRQHFRPILCLKYKCLAYLYRLVTVYRNNRNGEICIETVFCQLWTYSWCWLCSKKRRCFASVVETEWWIVYVLHTHKKLHWRQKVRKTSLCTPKQFPTSLLGFFKSKGRARTLQLISLIQLESETLSLFSPRALHIIHLSQHGVVVQNFCKLCQFTLSKREEILLKTQTHSRIVLCQWPIWPFI